MALSVQQPGVASAKLLDLKGLVHPTPFDGTDGKWPEWRYRFESMAVLLGADRVLAHAAARREDIDEQQEELDSDQRELSKIIWALLSQCCHGRAVNVVRTVARGSGFAAWQALVREYEPDLMPRHLAGLGSLLRPTFDERRFEAQLLEWEVKVDAWELGSGLRVKDAIRCGIVMMAAPPIPRQFSPAGYGECWWQLEGPEVSLAAVIFARAHLRRQGCAAHSRPCV